MSSQLRVTCTQHYLSPLAIPLPFAAAAAELPVRDKQLQNLRAAFVTMMMLLLQSRNAQFVSRVLATDEIQCLRVCDYE